MANKDISNKITEVWDNYISANKVVLNTKGKVINDIDDKRIKSIKVIKGYIESFLNNEIDIYLFKTTLDSYNKRNNLWGFTATKGQMFFNQLVKNNEEDIEKITSILKECISEPSNLEDALKKIERLEKFTESIFKKAKDKRRAANPGSIGYFLSYFWQIHNNKEWPILYTSIINAFKELEIWTDSSTQKENYDFFYKLNDKVKLILKEYTRKEISNWDAEHAFWNFSGKPIVNYQKAKAKDSDILTKTQEIQIKSNFDMNDYLIPKVAHLIDLGSETEKSSSAKGAEFERLVSEIFTLLDFETEFLGQGSGRKPDAIIKSREENTAFLVDAKNYLNGYSMGTDDRAIKEYIDNYCPTLQKNGYKKIGFIIVSNSFKSIPYSFINELTWNTNIKRFLFLTSEALLYLLAYKTKDKLSLSQIIECLINSGNTITPKDIIEHFDNP